jgi:hypothetical protein
VERTPRSAVAALAVQFGRNVERARIGLQNGAQARTAAVEIVDAIEVDLGEPLRRQTAVGKGGGNVREGEFCSARGSLGAHGRIGGSDGGNGGRQEKVSPIHVTSR